jgi:hypothetical protein
MPSVRTLVRCLIAAALAVVPLLAGLASPAGAQVSNPFSETDQAAAHSVTIAVTSVTPSWAKPSSTITVSGTITNDTGSPIPGIEVDVQTSGYQPFSTRSAMESFADGSTTSSYDLPDSEGPYALPRTLHTNVTMKWSVSFPASDVGYAGFGVYPLEAVAYNAYGDPLANDPTLLPYWPGGNAAQPVSVAWVWPLIDKPQADPCGTLTTNSLARSLSGSGRLSTLLNVGVQHQDSADLTWAVDPALLSDVSKMTSAYGVGGQVGTDSLCENVTPEPASGAATAWLAKLRQGTQDEPMFVTPYADVDISALAHAGLGSTADSDLGTAFKLGESAAQQVLNRPFGQNGDGTSDGTAPSVAWPADGTADASVLLSLAASNSASTLLLGSDELPDTTSTAVRTLSGVGTTDTVLLADSELSNLLGSASAQSPQGAQFATQQDFLAETAMIAAEYPSQKGRSLIVAPPQRWDPSATEAESLLSTTEQAPWLKPTSLSDLASAPTGDPQTLPGKQVSSAELSPGYMAQVESVDATLATFKNLLWEPGNRTLQTLQEAVAATQSSAWRGSARAGGEAALSRLSAYLSGALKSVQIITNSASQRVLLAGASGAMLVSVRNNLSVPVQVVVKATVPPGGPLSVGKVNSPIGVPAGKTGTVRIAVSSSDIGTTTLKLQLVTRNGSPLTPQAKTMSVQATRYGRALLILIAAALGVLVLTVVARRVRQWLNDTRAGSGGTG